MILPNENNDRDINKSKLLLVEGKDEVEFFDALLKKQNKYDQVQVIQVGGKDNFKFEFPAIINRTGFSEYVNSIAIVRDADNDYRGTFQSVKSLVSRCGLIPPQDPDTFTSNGEIKVGIFVMPGDFENGMLEDLCLKTQAENPIMNCVESFIQCVSTIEEIRQPKNLAKAKSQAFLSVMPELVKSVGLAAKKDYWNLEHDCLFNLNQFLKEL